MKNISKNHVGIAGEFAVLSQLALRGFDANLTLGNTKGVDILVSNPNTGSMYRLEVKTHHNNNPYKSNDFGSIEARWRMSDKHETNEDPNLFYCFVSIAKMTDSFNFYIIPSAIVAKFIRESHRYWLSGGTKRKDTIMRSFMLGIKGETYSLDTPRVDDYKSAWGLLN